jgi:hypothetical protein
VLLPLILGAVGLLLGGNARLRKQLVFSFRLKFGLEAPPAQAASLFYTRMLRLLERAGRRKAPSQTPMEFAASLSGARIASPVARFTDLCMAARFGGQRIDASQFTTLLEEIKLSLRARS